MSRIVVRINPEKQDRLPSLYDALTGPEPQSLCSTILDAQTGAILAEADWERRVWICTPLGERRIRSEIEQGDRSAA